MLKEDKNNGVNIWISGEGCVHLWYKFKNNKGYEKI